MDSFLATPCLFGISCGTGSSHVAEMYRIPILDLNATDYIELYVNQTNGDSQTLYRDTWLAGFKLNGV